MKSWLIWCGDSSRRRIGLSPCDGSTSRKIETRSVRWGFQRKKFRQKLVALNQWFKAMRNARPLREWWAILRQKLQGHYQYYGVSGNMRSRRAFYREVLRLAQKWINRRSQRKSYWGERFWRFLHYHPLPEPRIVHRIYQFV